jgi:demethylmenaquinone methyltransferase / 2-methoxy-6-polyprenyl-1,4-benzoquinol methylase
VPSPPSDSATVWDAERLSNPHAQTDKRSRVRSMFAAIAPAYDLNNHLHSLYIDQYWRRRTVSLAAVRSGETVVDVACGTGDLTLAFARTPAASVVGVDFTYEMLPPARRKSRRQAPRVSYVNGDAEALPLPDACADVVSIAFGIRNVQDPATALAEFRRVLKPTGRLVILEFSVPPNPLIRGVYGFYCSRIMPVTATWISRDRSGAYKYLPHSVDTFIKPPAMLAMMRTAGFDRVSATPMTFGSVTIYRGEVPAL